MTLLDTLPAGSFLTRPGIAACELGSNQSVSDLDRPEKTLAALQAAGMPAEAATSKCNMFRRCARVLSEHHGGRSPAFSFFVPGRIELLGKHTDYCGGRSLLCTVDRGFCVVACPRDDQRVTIYNVAADETVTFDEGKSEAFEDRHWAGYPLTVIRRVNQNFAGSVGGFDLAFESDLPQAAGLSSSSAFVVATFLFLSRLRRLETHPVYRRNIRSKEDLANYLGCCENGSSFGSLTGAKGVGTFGGSQDHTAILCCKPETLSTFRFCPVTRERDIAFPQNLVLAVCPTGVFAEKTRGAMDEYNAVSLRAKAMVDLWNSATDNQHTCLGDAIASAPNAVATLRSLLEAHDQRRPGLELVRRLDQFVRESEGIIPAAIDAFESSDYASLSALVDESQRLAETHLRNQTPETIGLQKRLRDQGAICASAFGAGFGGSVWGLFAVSTR